MKKVTALIVTLLLVFSIPIECYAKDKFSAKNTNSTSIEDHIITV